MKPCTLCFLIVLSLAACQSSDNEKEEETPEKKAPLFDLGITIPPGENREFAYTDKQDAYFYGRTHTQENDDWFSGWNVRTRRIFRDYQLALDGQALKREQATVTVYPNQLRRVYPNAEEELSLFDHKRVLSVQVRTAQGNNLSIALIGESIRFESQEGPTAFYTHTEYPDVVVGVAPRLPMDMHALVEGEQVSLSTGIASEGFFIALDSTKAAVQALLAEARQQHDNWAAERQARMENLITENNFFESNDPQLTNAIRWNILTLDQLIMQQTGYGIYAGLPWFNDYWGRDLFITLPGACLVTGQFEVARRILQDFAKYQNTDEASRNYGRVPNRLRPDDIIYNTTDGTPRYVIALFEYVQYTGDTALIRELYPSVQRATEGVIKYWMDDNGYLTHDDADTWMDARIESDRPMEEKLPWSPRGNRANDIQALWRHQLQASIYFAEQQGQQADADKWQAIADKLQQHFEQDFLDAQHPFMADRLKADGTPDFTLRPNQLFALDLVSDDSLRFGITRRAWEGLVYPWGVASLSQENPDFHPYHENPDYYHKDAAYHNGTVWLWNNGIAMQRMLEAGQTDEAYRLFQNMSRMTLDMGVVGGLSENTDALPQPGADWPRLSGTFLQAWSNAEYLRVWYEYFLGIRPDAVEQKIVIAPRLPQQLGALSFQEKVFGGKVEGHFMRGDGENTYRYVFHGLNTTIALHIGIFKPVEFLVKDGDELLLRLNSLEAAWQLLGQTPQPLVADPGLVRLQQDADEIFEDVTFCRPMLKPGLGALSGKDWLKKKRGG